MADFTLQGQVREGKGKNKVDKIRDAGFIPGVIYNSNPEEKNMNVQIPVLEFNKIYNEAGTSNLVDLDIDGETITVLITDVQEHPVRDDYLHVDFIQVKMDEKLRVTVPVILLNRDEIRLQPSILTQMLDEVDVECYPSYIPSTAEVNVEDMQYDDIMTVADLDVSTMEELEVLADPDEVVCSLAEPEEYVEEDFEDLDGVDAADVPEIGDEDEDAEAESEEAAEEDQE